MTNRTLCSEASYPPLKTAREDCANGVAPATVDPNMTNSNPAKMDYAKETMQR